MLPSQIRKVARERALLEVEKQKKDFMSWGVMGDWDKPYLTLSKCTTAIHTHKSSHGTNAGFRQGFRNSPTQSV
jgi:isoleucyl-tRNA synthetase